MTKLFPIMTALALGLAAHAAAAQEVGELARLTFEPGSANLGIEPGELSQIVTWAARHPGGLVVIDGHADRSVESPQLSLERAKAVRAQLVIAGVNPHQIVIAVFGRDAPARSVVVWGTEARRH